MRLEHLLSGGYDSKVVFSCCFKGTKAVVADETHYCHDFRKEKEFIDIIEDEIDMIIINRRLSY